VSQATFRRNTACPAMIDYLPPMLIGDQALPS
jgi:hypothetical protein